MTPDHLRRTIDQVVRLAVKAGMQHRRRSDVSRLQQTCVDFAGPIVDPVIEALIEETVEQALATGCVGWTSMECFQPPSPSSPLWAVWVAGALCAIDALGDVIGVAPAPLDGAAEDVAELLHDQVSAMLVKAGMMQIGAMLADAEAAPVD